MTAKSAPFTEALFSSVHVAVLAALPSEVRPFLWRRQAQRLKQTSLPLWLFTMTPFQGLLGLTGPGCEAAATKARFLCDCCRPRLLISCGFGGALTPALSPGDLVWGKRCYFYHPASHTLTPTPLASLKSAPYSLLTEQLNSVGLPAFPGTFISTPTVIAKAPHRPFLAHLPYPVLDLETAAVAAVAAEHGLPFLSLRVITDGADEEIPEFIAQAVAAGQSPGLRQALFWLLADPTRLLLLFRLWRRAEHAARRLSLALEMVIPLAGQF